MSSTGGKTETTVSSNPRRADAAGIDQTAVQKKIRISGFLRPDLIVSQLKSSEKDDVLKELIEKMLPLRRDLDGDCLFKVLLERERMGSTGVGGGLALPHALLENLGEPLLVLGRSRTGIPFDALDGKPVHLVVLVIADTGSIATYLRLLARLSRLLKDSALRTRLMAADDEAALLDILAEQDSRL